MEQLYFVAGSIKCCNIFEQLLGNVFHKVKGTLTPWLWNSTLDISTGVMKTCSPKDLYKNVYRSCSHNCAEIETTHMLTSRVELRSRWAIHTMEGGQWELDLAHARSWDLMVRFSGIFQNNWWHVNNLKFSTFRVFTSWKLANATIWNFLFWFGFGFWVFSFFLKSSLNIYQHITEYNSKIKSNKLLVS